MIEIENKFEKFLLSLTGVLFVVIVVLIMKEKDELLRKEIFKENIKTKSLETDNLDIQTKIEKNREKIINEIIDSPEKKIVEEAVETTTTPPPPPPAEAVVEKKSDKKTKSS